MGDVAIRVRGVSKRYEVFENQRSRVLHAFWPRYRNGMQEIWALRDVDFEVARGESVGVIGRNGGGKSTLLQILTGILTPTQGHVEVNGRVSALLELGSGFNPDYTGRDNVVLNGLLLGLSREEILGRFGEIADFAGIGDAIDRPAKTYSSGMLMRLAFAVQVLTDPDILIVDEALSVGDFFFQQKCFARLRAMRERGLTLIFVSHDMRTVRDLCSRAVYLRHGEARFVGETRLAIGKFLAEGSGDGPRAVASYGGASSAEPGELRAILRDALWARPTEHGPDDDGHLIAVALYDDEGRPGTSFALGQVVTAKVAYRPKRRVQTHVALSLWNRYDQVVTAITSSTLGLAPPECPAGQVGVFEVQVKMMLEAGHYAVMFALSEATVPNQGSNLDSTPRLGPLVIHWDYENRSAPFLGMVGLPAEANFRVLQDTAIEIPA